MQVSEITKPFLNKTNNRLVSLLAGTGSIQLGILSSIGFIGYTLYNSYDNYSFNLRIIDQLLMFLSVIFVFIIINVNSEYKRNYNVEIYDSFNKYKEYVNKCNRQ